MTGYGPPPTITIAEALTSVDKRRERDRQLAAWCGLTPDEIGPFLERLALYDVREAARQEEEAISRLHEAQAERRSLIRRMPRRRAA